MVGLLVLSLRVRMAVDINVLSERVMGSWCHLAVVRSLPMLPGVQSRMATRLVYLLCLQEMQHVL